MNKWLKKAAAIALTAATVLSATVSVSAENETTVTTVPPTIILEDTTTTTTTGSWSDLIDDGTTPPPIIVDDENGGSDDSGGSTGNTTEVKFFSDKQFTTEIKAVTGGIYVNGGKVAPDGGKNKIDYKSTTIYSNMVAKELYPGGDTTKKLKAGKITVAVTMSAETPTLTKGKVPKDKDAANILKATFKKNDGSLKLTAAKEPGTVYVHLLDISVNKEIEQAVSIPVTVYEASAKVAIYYGNEIAKKNSANIGESLTFRVMAQKKSGEILNGSEFIIEVDKKSADYVEYTYDRGELIVTAKGLDSKKAGKTISSKITVMDNKSAKKATVTVIIKDSAASVSTELVPSTEADATNDLKKAKSKLDLKYTVASGSGNTTTTDKLKIYVCKVGTKPSVNEKNKVEFTKATEVSAKLNAKTGLLNLSTKIDEPSCDIYAVYTDSTDKTSQVFPVAYITDGTVMTIGAESNAWR